MHTTTPSELQSRLDFIKLDQEALDGVASITPIIERHLDLALTRFYERLMAAPEVARHFSGTEQATRAKSNQSKHWRAIASGKLDGEYIKSATIIGNVHARIGLEPRWYIGGYGLIVETLIEGVLADALSERLPKSRLGLDRRFSRREVLAATDEVGRLITSLVKAMLVDVDIAVSTYFERKTAEAAELNQQIGRVAEAAENGDLAARVECGSTDPAILGLAQGVNALLATVEKGIGATAATMARFAEADLSGRMDGVFSGAFAELQSDVNSVGDKLTTIIGQLRETTGALRTATGEILAGANDLSERTTRQAATIEETSAAMEQLADTVAENAARAETGAGKARTVAAAAVTGGEAMQRAHSAMERISLSSGKIASIIGLIDDIAFQTNLLALNASVEAARAGESGKGFAVVAVEVRRLAQSAAEASSDIKSLIDVSMADVADGSKLVEEAAKRLKDMIGPIEENTSLMEAIAGATSQQASAISEMHVAVRQLDEMTQHNAALVEETNAAIEQTEGRAGELDRLVDVFHIGRQDAAPTAVRPAARSQSPKPAVNPPHQPPRKVVGSDWNEF